MAKLRLPPDIPLAEVIPQLAEIGITVDPNPLPDGSYRTYVRKDHLARFLTYVKASDNQIVKPLNC